MPLPINPKKLVKLSWLTMLFYGKSSSIILATQRISAPAAGINLSVSDKFIKEGMNDIDLVMYKPARYTNEESLAQAVHILKRADTWSTCKRAAMKQLTSSCQSLDGTATKEEMFGEALEKVQRLFAARSAGCEFDDAGIPFPFQCSAIMSFSTPARKTKADADIGKDELKSCLNAINAREQSWTSYNNGLQIADVVCQAASSEVDREAALKLLQNLAETIEHLHPVTSDILRQAVAYREEEIQFMQQLRSLQEEHTQDLADAYETGMSSMNRLFKYVNNLFSHTTDSFETLIVTVHERVEGLQTSIDDTSTKAVANFDRIWLTTLSNHAALMAQHDTSAGVISNKMQAFETLLQGLTHSFIPQFRESLLQSTQLANELGAVISSSDLVLGNVAQEKRLQDLYADFIDLHNQALETGRLHKEIAEDTTAALRQTNAITESVAIQLREMNAEVREAKVNNEEYMRLVSAVSSLMWVFRPRGLGYLCAILSCIWGFWYLPPRGRHVFGVVCAIMVLVAVGHYEYMALPAEAGIDIARATTAGITVMFFTLVSLVYAYIAPKCVDIYQARSRALKAKQEEKRRGFMVGETREEEYERKRSSRAQTAPAWV